MPIPIQSITKAVSEQPRRKDFNKFQDILAGLTRKDLRWFDDYIKDARITYSDHYRMWHPGMPGNNVFSEAIFGLDIKRIELYGSLLGKMLKEIE